MDIKYLLFSMAFSIIGFILATIEGNSEEVEPFIRSTEKNSGQNTELPHVSPVQKKKLDVSIRRTIIGRSFREYSLRVFCHSSNSEEILIKFEYPWLSSWFTHLRIKELSSENMVFLRNYKNIVVELVNIDIDKDTFKTIVEKIRPTELYIDGCNLTDENIKDVKLNDNIKTFILCSSNITNMDGLFGDWNKELTEVNILHNNKLESLPAGLGHVCNLKKLNIEYNNSILKNWNKLSDEAIKNYEPFKNIIILNLGSRQLDFMEEDKLCKFLELFPNLTNLDLSRTKLKTILIPLKKLETLDLSYNSELKQIKFTENSVKLKHLDISFCEKLSIDDMLLEKLRSGSSLIYLKTTGSSLSEKVRSEISSIIESNRQNSNPTAS